MSNEPNKTLDRILDGLGAAAVMAPMLLPAGLPWYVYSGVTLLGVVFGRAANKGLPVYSSITSPFKGKSGQMVDPEDPR